MAVTRVCLYTRISTDEENQPTSLHSQRERLEAFCTAQEHRSFPLRADQSRAGGHKKTLRPPLGSLALVVEIVQSIECILQELLLDLRCDHAEEIVTIGRAPNGGPEVPSRADGRSPDEREHAGAFHRPE